MPSRAKNLGRPGELGVKKNLKVLDSRRRKEKHAIQNKREKKRDNYPLGRDAFYSLTSRKKGKSSFSSSKRKEKLKPAKKRRVKKDGLPRRGFMGFKMKKKEYQERRGEDSESEK